MRASCEVHFLDPACKLRSAGRGFFLIGQVALQQRFEFVDALIAPAFVDNGHADRHKVDRLRIRALDAGSATAGRGLNGAVGQVTGDLASVVIG